MFKMKLALIGLTISALLAFALPVSAQQMATPAKHAILLDASTGSILFEKDADEPFPPASMSKLMTVYLAFDAIKQGTMRLDDKVVVIDHFSATGFCFAGICPANGDPGKACHPS